MKEFIIVFIESELKKHKNENNFDFKIIKANTAQEAVDIFTNEFNHTDRPIISVSRIVKNWKQKPFDIIGSIINKRNNN